jgi:hypothetical protein
MQAPQPQIASTHDHEMAERVQQLEQSLAETTQAAAALKAALAKTDDRLAKVEKHRQAHGWTWAALLLLLAVVVQVGCAVLVSNGERLFCL